MNIILIGAQGSGKGTQAAKLSQALGVQHISSGDLFRQALDEQTESGLKARVYLDRGELVPDDITVTMVLERIAQPDCTEGIVLDGFPRTIAQAQALDYSLARIEKRIDSAVYIEVPRTELLRRLSSRYICRANQHVYNSMTCPPEVAGICDIDGSELYQRADDRGEAVQKRLGIFFCETIHLLEYYKTQKNLLTIDGNQEVDRVQSDFVKELKAFSKRTKGKNALPWPVPLSIGGSAVTQE